MTPAEKLAALNQVLQHARISPLYRARIPSEPLSSVAELRTIPLTTKEDLRRHSPFGVLCVPREELSQYHETFGTTGTPVSTWFTKDDVLANATEIILSGIGLNTTDIVLVRFPYAISAVAHMVHAAAQLKGACVIPASARSTVSPFPRIVNMLQRLDVTVLACLPLQAILIAETAELLGLNPAKDFPSLRAILTAGEPLTSGRRKLLEDVWGLPIIDVYGMAEIGTAITDCEYGHPHPLEDYFIFEILDEDLETEVPPGKLGYLVITTLRKKATPVIRYLTEDRARVIHKNCPCGRSLWLEVHGRKQDTILLRNRTLDLWDLDEIVSNLPCRRFWVVGAEAEGLHFIIEEEKTGDSISDDLVRLLEKKYQLKLQFEIVPKGTIYDRSELLAIAEVGKPRYIYSAEEIKRGAYLKAART